MRTNGDQQGKVGKINRPVVNEGNFYTLDELLCKLAQVDTRTCMYVYANGVQVNNYQVVETTLTDGSIVRDLRLS